MATSDSTQKQCSQKDRCLNPLGSWLPASTDYFHRDNTKDDGLNTTCKVCACARAAAWRNKHPERVIQWREEHPDYQERWYEQNRERHLENSRRYNQTHPNLSKEKSDRRRDRLKKAGGRFTKRDKIRQLKSQAYRCWYCGAAITLANCHTDHIVPLSRGGANTPENIVATCATCNLKKGERLPQEWNGRLF